MPFNDQIAPEHDPEGIPGVTRVKSPRTRKQAPPPPDDSEPVEHNDIRNTPVSMPDVKAKRASKLQSELQAFYTFMGTGIFPFDPQVGAVVIEQSGPCAQALSDLAAKNATVRKALESLMSASAYTAVITAHLPIAVVVATKYVPPVRDNYGKIMDQFNGKKDVA